MAKYVFVTGGVTSSLGKGITAASIGRLLKARGLRVSILKLRIMFLKRPKGAAPSPAGYQNVNSGTRSRPGRIGAVASNNTLAPKP